MMNLAGDTCRRCAHWSNKVPPVATGQRRPHGAAEDIGTCHVFAPTMFEMGGEIVSRWPQTHADRSCGEWSPEMPDPEATNVTLLRPKR